MSAAALWGSACRTPPRGFSMSNCGRPSPRMRPRRISTNLTEAESVISGLPPELGPFFGSTRDTGAVEVGGRLGFSAHQGRGPGNGAYPCAGWRAYPS
jgi:hypothetical protein